MVEQGDANQLAKDIEAEAEDHDGHGAISPELRMPSIWDPVSGREGIPPRAPRYRSELGRTQRKEAHGIARRLPKETRYVPVQP